MHICQTGKISDNFYFLGHSAVPIYLLDGPKPLLFDAGFSGLSHLYVKEIRAVLGNRSPAFLFLTHAHWDHVGAAAYFKEIWPHMKIAGSLKSAQILARKGALAQIKRLNKRGLEALRSWGVNHIFEGEFKPFGFDIVLEGGQEMNIGEGLTLDVIAAPGHTWDSTAYYLQERKILIPGEAVGCDGVCDFLVDHEAYAASLRQLAGLNAEILCTAHKDIYTGKDVRKNMIKYMHMLEEYVAQVKRYLKDEQGDIDRTVACIRRAQWDPRPFPKQPLEPYMINTRARVKTILKHMST